MHHQYIIRRIFVIFKRGDFDRKPAPIESCLVHGKSKYNQHVLVLEVAIVGHKGQKLICHQ